MNKKLLIIDGNSIMNRAFYGIMSSKMLTAPDGTYTNALYGFLAILFKQLDDIRPDYIAVAFDLKAPTHRHKMYDAYKAGRHAMPEELTQQMPIIKEILSDMNITIIEKEGYEADDILGIMSVRATTENIDTIILSGDRDTFQLINKNVTVRIPRTKAGKTENEDFDVAKVKEVYGLEPKQLIQVKGLMGDPSDNIPGIPGVGEKTALKLIQNYKTISNVYNAIATGECNSGECTIKGALKDKIINNRDLAELSLTLGTILLDGDIGCNLDDLKTKEWDTEKVTKRFKELRFNRFLDRFNLNNIKVEDNEKSVNIDELVKIIEFNIESDKDKINELIEQLKMEKELIYYISYINTIVESICILNKKTDEEVYIKINGKVDEFNLCFKEIFENLTVSKIGYKLRKDYVELSNIGIICQNLSYDAEIAGYDLNPTEKNTLEELAIKYLDIDINEYIGNKFNTETNTNQQINLFDTNVQEKDEEKLKQEKNKYYSAICVYSIEKLKNITIKKLEEISALELFNNIEMPLVEVLGSMQHEGIYVDKEELKSFGSELQTQINSLTLQIYELAGEEFNINSHQQLGHILFEKLKLSSKKKTKSGFSTDVDVLEKIRFEHPIVEKVLEYRTLTKLNSTYVEGLIQYIDKNSKIHTSFHQTITATGRISSTDPNLQNIPTRAELGKNIRKAFKPQQGNVFIDADYSQIELRVLADISQDKNMLDAFKNGEDIHKQAASKVLGIPIEEVTKEERSKAKAVNFGIVYGISDFGLANQIGVSNKQAKEYIEQYLQKYNGIKNFMDDIVESAKQKGYVETLFHRRRYIPELQSKNYMVRQFGNRIAMNTPIQGTAADIMKIAMIRAFKTLKESKLDAKLILQIHDELLVEVSEKDKEKAKKLLYDCMVNATKLSIPLEAEVSEGYNWNEVK